MKRFILLAAAATVVIVMAATAFAASTSTTVGVTAAVKKVCANAVAGSIGSGTPIDIDPTAGTSIYSAGADDATVECTKNFSNISITAYGGNSGTYTAAAPYTCQGNATYSPTAGGFKLGDGTSTINYSFACNAIVTGQGVGTPVALGTSIQILGSDKAAAVDNGSNYTDTINLTINY